MQGFGIGAGLAALAFWGFLASVVVAGIWYDARKRESQHETVRRLIESGKSTDKELMDKLLSLSSGKRSRLDRDFKITALIVSAAAIGVAIVGLILGTQFPPTKLPILSGAALLACMGIGFFVASRMASRWYPADRDSNLDQF